MNITAATEIPFSLLTDARLLAMVDNSAGVQMLVDREGIIEYASPSATKVFGWNSKELKGRRWLDILIEEDRHVLASLFHDIRNVPGASRRRRFRITTANGSISHIAVKVANRLDDPAVGAYVCSCIDITERETVELALMRSEEEHRRLFHDAPLPMIVFDPESLRILHVNRAACDLYQYNDEEFIELTITDIGSAPRRETFLQTIAPQIATLHTKVSYHTVHHKKNGDRIDIELHIHPTVFDGLPARIAQLKDITESLRARNELAMAEANLKSVFDNVAAALFSVDLEYRFLTFNSYMERILRANLGIELRVGMNMIEALPPERRPFWVDAFDRAFQGKRFLGERTLSSPGDESIVEFSATPLLDGDRIIGASVIGRDITEHKQSMEQLALQAEALAQSVAQHRKLFDETPLPMWVIDIETLRFLRVNRAACELYGYSEAEFLEMTPLSLQDESDRENFIQVTTPKIKDLDDEEPMLARHKKRSGEIIHVSVRSHVVQYGDRRARMALLEDVTKRVKAERDLREANERFRLATEAVNSVIYDWDIASGTSINTAGLIPLLGFDPVNDTGVDTIDWWNSRIHPDDQFSTVWAIDHALAEGSRFELEYRMRHKDGHYVYVWDRGVITRDLEGNAIRVIGSTQEITTRKRMEAHLLQERNHALDAKQSAEEMSRLKTNFPPNRGHEIRTPMPAILGFSEILAENLVGTPEGGHAEIIVSSAKRLLETINSILDLARVESRKVVLNPTEVDVNQEVQQLVNLLEPLASQRNLDLYLKPSLEHSLVMTDAHFLSQIVTNLIGNALKFTHEGHVAARVQIGSETETPVPTVPGFVSFSTAPHPTGEHFRIIVEDSGAGIARESLGRIFDEFKQESTGYDRSHEGTGLGLTISSKLASAMGGSIEVRSAQGVGSMFIVRLPVGERMKDEG